ncbi:hypothetical protein ACFVZ4_15685 [Streptomyces goshikiensis]|uniref:hypothetical protein n=1 Tax=Streptomyces goshikiensis TaxID=1942 RepID=UPI0036C427D9
MGLLALVPVAMTADILVVQVLSASIAARIAYSYGCDAKDPDEQVFIQRLVRRSFMAQAAKAEPLRETARAANAVKGRTRWSEKLRQDHRCPDRGKAVAVRRPATAGHRRGRSR